MKGQAFIGLPSEKSAERALRDTNGYVLNDKPLVVVSFTVPDTRPVFQGECECSDLIFVLRHF